MQGPWNVGIRIPSRSRAYKPDIIETEFSCEPHSSCVQQRYIQLFPISLILIILINGVIDDPITPAYAGRQMSSRFGKMARHVVQNGTGKGGLFGQTHVHRKLI